MTSRRKPVAATLKHPMVDFQFRADLERCIFHATEESPYWESECFFGLAISTQFRFIERWGRHHEMSRTVERHLSDD